MTQDYNSEAFDELITKIVNEINDVTIQVHWISFLNILKQKMGNNRLVANFILPSIGDRFTNVCQLYIDRPNNDRGSNSVISIKPVGTNCSGVAAHVGCEVAFNFDLNPMTKEKEIRKELNKFFKMLKEFKDE